LTTRWEKLKATNVHQGRTRGHVHFFVDEFSEFTDASIGETAIRLMQHLGYTVAIHGMTESGRALLSKGFVRKAAGIAESNVGFFSNLIGSETPLVGIEPSAILSFRDEYPVLVRSSLQKTARELAVHAYSFVEWIYREMQAGRITSNDFVDTKASILFHEHCHQKALGEKNITQQILSLPRNYSVQTIPSGCCGMAGSFGYEKEHYDLSMRIGELVLFPAVRNAGNEHIIAASGTSCRHQILDGTGKKALHPAEVLYHALLK
jgi:Fe-S oxidoreductase